MIRPLAAALAALAFGGCAPHAALPLPPVVLVTEAGYPSAAHHPTQRLDVLMTGNDTTARCFMSYNGHGIYYDRATDTTICEGAQ